MGRLYAGRRGRGEWRGRFGVHQCIFQGRERGGKESKCRSFRGCIASLLYFGTAIFAWELGGTRQPSQAMLKAEALKPLKMHTALIMYSNAYTNARRLGEKRQPKLGAEHFSCLKAGWDGKKQSRPLQKPLQKLWRVLLCVIRVFCFHELIEADTDRRRSCRQEKRLQRCPWQIKLESLRVFLMYTQRRGLAERSSVLTVP